jgi:hypothetical protein
MGIFILTFYGNNEQSSKSNYTVHDRRSVGVLFPSCALKFTNDFIGYSESTAGRWCAEQLNSQAYCADKVAATDTMALDEVGERENPTAFDVETNLFEILDRWQFAKTDSFEVGIEGIRVIRNTEQG